MKRLLIIVDFQNDFVSGSLGFEKAKQLEQPIVEKAKQAIQNNEDVVFTFDTHEADYLMTAEGKHLPIEHCIKDSDGWQIYGQVKQFLPQAKERFIKNTFGSKALFLYLQQHPYDEIELVGLVSNICVLSNAVLAKAAQPEASIIVDAHCTASFDDTMNEKALDILEGLHITVLNR